MPSNGDPQIKNFSILEMFLAGFRLSAAYGVEDLVKASFWGEGIKRDY